MAYPSGPAGAFVGSATPAVGAFGLLGAGGQADEAAAYSHAAIAFRAVSADFLDPADATLIDIGTDDPGITGTPVTAAVGAPAIRRALVSAWHGTSYRSIIADGALVDTSAVIGAGAIIAPGAVVTTGVTIGAHVIVNVAASVSHDSVLADFVTVSPG